MDAARQEELIARAQRRDPAALDQLVTAYAPRVFGLLLRLGGVREQAEDLMQETFLRMVRMIDRYQHDGRFEAWLFRIAANLARDAARSGRRRGRVASLDVSNDGDGAARLADVNVEAPDAGLAAQEQCAALMAAFAQLSALEREILALRHQAGLSFREIAELQGVPLGTALARAHRAVQKLKGLLPPEYV